MGYSSLLLHVSNWCLLCWKVNIYILHFNISVETFVSLCGPKPHFEDQTFWIRTKMDVSETLFVPMNRYWTVRKQVRRRAERAQKERGERWRQVSGIVQGRPAQEEAPTQPHHLHHLPAAWAGACLREVPLPRRVQPWGTRHEGEPPRGPSSGRRKFSITPAKCMSVHEVCVIKSPCLQPAVFAFSFCCLIFMVEEGSF